MASEKADKQPGIRDVPFLFDISSVSLSFFFPSYFRNCVSLATKEHLHLPHLLRPHTAALLRVRRPAADQGAGRQVGPRRRGEVLEVSGEGLKSVPGVRNERMPCHLKILKGVGNLLGGKCIGLL